MLVGPAAGGFIGRRGVTDYVAALTDGGLAGARRPTAGATAKAACRAAGEALAGWVGCFVLFAVYVAALVF